jgi:peptidoglycan/xylan/chitin deacetylase (PgdA/CDA1 family)
MLSSIGTIFMLHRVFPYEKGNILYNENMKLSPEELDRIILSLKQDKRIFLSLDELTEIVKSKKQTRHKFIVFTLDDGYKDNLTHAYPVFKSHRVPFCVYVTNSFPDQTADLWWYALEQLILQNDVLRFPNGNRASNNTMSKKKKNFLLLRRDVLNEYFKDPIAYFKRVGELQFDIANERKKLCLTWDEIKLLSNDPLVTIGSHTVNHYPLSKLDYQTAENEIRLSKTDLERKLDRKIKHFAFPFGSKNEADEREYKIIKSIGFDTAVTTLHGRFHISGDLQKLDRIFLSPSKNDPHLVKRNIFWTIKSIVGKVKSHL